MGALWHSDASRTALPASEPAALVTPNTPPPRPRRHKLRIWSGLLVIFLLLGLAIQRELESAYWQAHFLSRYAEKLSYTLQPGPSHHITFPGAGPFDRRMGYAQLPQLLERLQQRHFQITLQARQSDALLAYSQHGLFIPFSEKMQAGLAINDCRAEPLYLFRYPQQLYPSFGNIPPMVVNSLLFIENRHLLDPTQSQANPAVDWPRFAKAALSQAGRHFELQEQSAGGSTLATQLEKYRHSADGRTLSAADKLRQMVSASVRAYSEGSDTMAVRQRIVRDYLNSVPLSAAPGHGEVHGLADGLRVWFGADFERVNALLEADRTPQADNSERGLALRQVLALIIAQRRPSYYLSQGRTALEALTDSHLRLLASGGVIDTALSEAAQAQRLHFRDLQQHPAIQPVQFNKTVSVARMRLAGLLGLSLYDLDRIDLTASSTLNAVLQEQVGAYLRQLADPSFAGQIGLYGERMLSPEKTAEVRYSFTLFERSPDGARVRVQTDSTDQPFDLNEGSKLELGSTAKLRVLTTYLEVIAELHGRYAGQSREMLRQVEVARQDNLSRWVVDQLIASPELGLREILEAALERKYSASPHETFFTGGGAHTFSNFRREDNSRIPTLRVALQESINLPFIRLLRDLVRHSTYHGESSSAALLQDDSHPLRESYLRRFADREGTTFLLRFWRKYQGQSAQQRLDTFLGGLRPTATRLAAVHRYLMPEVDQTTFAAFLKAHLPQENLSERKIDQLYQDYGPGAWSLPDQGYIARVHPLELWLLGYLIEHPQASFSNAVAASIGERQEVYGWLFRTRHKSARDNRIRTMLEVEAFLDIHQRWQRLGYPFAHLVPSLATAIGSSGDRPAALAELMGIIQNDGIRQPSVRIDRLHFATDTPYETQLHQDNQRGERVLPSEVAAALRDALSLVVEAGTARRLQGSFRLGDGTALLLGGKTGTGDNRIESVTRGGQVLSSRAMNRTATFVFYLGPRHFGTLTAFVPGQKAEGFRFTSALPVQVLRGMAPILTPYLEPARQTGCGRLPLPAAARLQ